MLHIQYVPQRIHVPPSLPRPEIQLDRWQYRLTAAPHPGGRRCGAYWLSVGEGLSIAEVVDRNGLPCGMLLGFPIDLRAACLIRGLWHLPHGCGVRTDDAIHTTLRALGGRFVWIAPHPSGTRIYPDAAAQVTCVWDAAGKEAGSTAGAILEQSDYQKRFRARLFDELGIRREGWFPAGLTAHHGVQRLLPNHYLDLTTWTAHRFAATTPSNPKPNEVIDGISDIVRLQAKALLTDEKAVAAALTAGRDSRAILACLRDMAQDLTFVTVTGGDRHQVDSIIASRLTDAFDLSHQTLPRKTADETAQARFIRRGGHCYADSNTRFHPSIAPLADDYVFIGGLGGEIARAFYWTKDDLPSLEVTPALLMKRFGLRPSPTVEDALSDWLDSLPPMDDARDILDLAYVELRLGPWAMAQFCTDPTLQRYSPMISYDAVRLLLDLQHDWKVGDRLNEAIVQRLWPELNDHPYNTLGPWRDRWIKAQRVLENPSLIAKKLRQRFG